MYKSHLAWCDIFQMTTDKNGRHADTAVVLNHDILLHILDFLHMKMKARDLPARVALARCARVSHAFSNPALRLLWATLHNPLPLWRLLEPDRTTDHTGQQKSNQQLLQTIVDAQLWNDRYRWDRFLYYAQLVRDLSFHAAWWDGLNDLHLQVVRAVVEHNGGQTVVPSLSAFTWTLPIMMKTHEEIVWLLSPTVVRLVFDPDSSGQRSDPLLCEGVFCSIRNAAPSVEEFISMRTHFWPIRLVDELVQFQHLRTVQVVTALPHGDIRILLTKLRLTYLRVCAFLDTGSANPPLRAESLRVLAINGAPPDLAAILSAWSFPTLQRAEIELFDENTDGGADLHTPGLLAAIIAPLPHDVLRDLDISVGVARPSITTRAALPFGLFLRPTFQLHSLRAFRLTFTATVPLSADDATFAELAAAWPSLRTLQLEFRAWHVDGPIPTPLVLLSLAQSCTNLQKLVLPYLDHTLELERLPQQGAPPAAGHHLRNLFIADDRSKEDITPEVTEALCGFVGELFPHLSPQFRRYLRELGKAWTEVLRRLREGRRHV